MKRIGHGLPVIIMASLLLAAAPLILAATTVEADPLLSRSVTIGNSQASANTFHRFDFVLPTAGTLGSIEFEYCSNSPFVGTACTAPNGLNLSGAVIGAQSGASGFSIDGSSTSNKIVLTRAPSANLALQSASYRFDNVINNSDPNSTVYVRVSTFASTDASGPRTDSGAVLFSTAPGVTVEGYVPPYLTFCTGLTVATNCSSQSGDYINFGELSSQTPRLGTSQYSGSTNDPGGFTTTVTGTTMTSGNHIIPALSTPKSSAPGTSQFGINLRANSSPSVGKNKTGIGSSTAINGYNTQNQFKFASQVISQSTKSTDFNRFTVSYLVNISPNQPPGIYVATLTYIAVAAF